MMRQPVQIEPVPPEARRETVRFLVGGDRRDVSAALRAEAYERMISACADPCRFWWARRGRRCVAASLVLPSTGRVGFLFHSEPDAPGVEGEWVAPVIRQAADEALADGLSFVQSLVVPERKADIDVLVLSGFRRLAELVYMRLDLAARDWPEDGPACVWRRYGQYDERELREVILGTYEGSLDCPGLCGLRNISDVIAGHRASGIFSPESWWIAEVSGRPAGCVLVNESSSCPQEADLVYMGVLREWRGRGLGMAMVHRAARRCGQDGRQALTVAVDAENVYAKRIYDRVGFRETTRRTAMFRPRRPLGAGPS